MTAAAPRTGRLERFFYMYLTPLVLVVAYSTLCDRTAYSAEGVRHALTVMFGITTAYVVLAYVRGELKQLDLGAWTLFGLGTLLTRADVGSALWLFQNYSPALVSFAFGLTILIPLVLGRETFTVHYARRSTPKWQQKLPWYTPLNRALTAYWVLIFFAAAGLAAWKPHDPLFTVLLSNLVIFALGVPAPLWFVPLYFRLFPPGLPTTLEPLILGMPFVFNRRAAGDAQATVQYRVSGPDGGDYVVRIAGGKCVSFAGTAPAPDLTVHTPDAVWVRVARGELDGGQALGEGLYRVEGDLALLMRMGKWFRAGG